jgi:hypothetical protein
VSADLTFQAEVPAVAGAKACLQAGVSVPGGTLRVDTHVVDGALTSPMCLVTSGGPAFRAHAMSGLVDVVEARLLVTCIGTSVELVTQLRARAVRALVGRDRATRAPYTALTVAGMVVVRRELTEDRLPPVSQGGGWVNAALPVTLHLQPAS